MSSSSAAKPVSAKPTIDAPITSRMRRGSLRTASEMMMYAGMTIVMMPLRMFTGATSRRCTMDEMPWMSSVTPSAVACAYAEMSSVRPMPKTAAIIEIRSVRRCTRVSGESMTCTFCAGVTSALTVASTSAGMTRVYGHNL